MHAWSLQALSHFKHGVRDLKQLLEIDPQNSDAQKEFESMKDLWREVRSFIMRRLLRAPW